MDNYESLAMFGICRSVGKIVDGSESISNWSLSWLIERGVEGWVLH